MQRPHFGFKVDWHRTRYAAMFVLVVIIVCAGIARFVPPVAGHLAHLMTRMHPAVAANNATSTTDAARAHELETLESSRSPDANQFIPVASDYRTIPHVTIADVVPPTGKFIVADLSAMKLTLYVNGVASSSFKILTRGKPGTPWDTPAGQYMIQYKENSHFSRIGKVYMPYSMQFMGNYFIHGWPYYPGGEPVASTYSGGCIRLSTADAAKVYACADAVDGQSRGTGIFVWDPKKLPKLAPLTLSMDTLPDVSASAYLVADLDTGSVYTERGRDATEHMASTTALMTALVANEVINFEKQVPVAPAELSLAPEVSTFTRISESFTVNDLLYPLLMQSNPAVADALARFYGPKGFVSWMNTTAHALNMQSTTFSDAGDYLASNITTTDDMYRLVAYLVDKKSFIFNIAGTNQKIITAASGGMYTVTNTDGWLATTTRSIASHTATTTASSSPATTTPVWALKHTATSTTDGSAVTIATTNVGGVTRRVAIIVLDSAIPTTDASTLASWWQSAVVRGDKEKSAACAVCTNPTKYRVIER